MLFKFYNSIPSFNTSETFFAQITDNIYDVDQLLMCMYYVLCFPSYYGVNWNALNECLRDLEWIEQRNVVVIHRELPKIKHHELVTYIDILDFCIKDWISYNEKTPNTGLNHNFDVYFQDIDRDIIEKLLMEK